MLRTTSLFLMIVSGMLSASAQVAMDPADKNLDGLIYIPENRVLEQIESEVMIWPDKQSPHEMLRPAAKAEAVDLPRDWTILFYNDADFYPGYDPSSDFADDVYSCGNVDVVMLTDTYTTEAAIYHCPGAGVQTLLESRGELDMGHYTTLRDFIQWGKDNYPADRYLLCLYDHGAGFCGACIDQTCVPTTILSMDDMQAALTETGGVDIIAFTAPCLMGAVESVYELRDCVDYYVGSEEISGYYLWLTTLGSLCDQLALGDAVSTETIAGFMVQMVSQNPLPAYFGSYWTMCAASAAHVTDLAEAMDELARYLRNHVRRLSEDIQVARDATWTLGKPIWHDKNYDTVDLRDAIYQLDQAIDDPTVTALCQTALEAFDAVVVAEWHDTGSLRAHGLSTYFPRFSWDYNPYYAMLSLDYTDDFGWDEFLAAYFATIMPGNKSGGGQDLLVGNSPNPFVNTTTISFRVPESGPVSVQVFDLAGRLVRTLRNETMASGSPNVIWDGSDDSGRRVPSATYFCRIDTGGQTVMKRMTLIR